MIIENSITSMLSETLHLAGLDDVPVVSAEGEISRRQPGDTLRRAAPGHGRYAMPVGSTRSRHGTRGAGADLQRNLILRGAVVSLNKPATNFPRGLRETSVPTALVVPVPSNAARPRRLGTVVGRGGYAWAATSHFSRSPQPPSRWRSLRCGQVTPSRWSTASTEALSARPSGCPSRASTI